MYEEAAMMIAILMLLACGLTGLMCFAEHLCHSGFPTVSLWWFRRRER